MKKGYNKINEKEIFVVDDHHHVLEAWAKYRCANDKPALLLSLDHHTDSIPAFCRSTFDYSTHRHIPKLAEQYIQEIDFCKPESIKAAINRLRNDEHIDAATRSGIVDIAFIISYSESFDKPASHEISRYREELDKNRFTGALPPVEPKRPFTYPLQRIYIVGNMCSVNCSKSVHDDDCLVLHFNDAIETSFLKHKLSIFNEMMPGVCSTAGLNRPYILDIDLDYFHTRKAIKPSDHALFLNIIKHASLITIAKEKSCVDQWRKYDKKISSRHLLDCLEHHIDVATR